MTETLVTKNIIKRGNEYKNISVKEKEKRKSQLFLKKVQIRV